MSKPNPYLKTAIETEMFSARMKKIAEKMTKTLMHGSGASPKATGGRIAASSSGVYSHMFSSSMTYGVIHRNPIPFGTIMERPIVSPPGKDLVMVISPKARVATSDLTSAIDMATGERRVINAGLWKEVPIEKP